MSQKFMIALLVALQAATVAIAQSAAPASAPASNPHKAYDDKARVCRKQAVDAGLKGDELRDFVARCMKA